MRDEYHVKKVDKCLMIRHSYAFRLVKHTFAAGKAYLCLWYRIVVPSVPDTLDIPVLQLDPLSTIYYIGTKVKTG